MLTSLGVRSSVLVLLSCAPILAEMTTKFNKDMYTKMRSKKDEPLSNIGKKGVRVTGKGPSVTPVTSATPIISAVKTVRTASPSSKRLRTTGRERERADSYSSIV